eukprot:scaffold6776_cov99-Skeletonema_dohrnii-CCMP3373.AAC.13
MNNDNSTAAAQPLKKLAARNVSDKVGDKSKAKRTYGGRGMGLMKRPNGPNNPRDFGRGGKHKFAGKLRRGSPLSKPMRLSRRLSWKIQRSSPLRSPISAVRLNWTPQTRDSDLKQHAHSVEEGEVKTPQANED